MILPDEATFTTSEDKPRVQRAMWEKAVAYWRTLPKTTCGRDKPKSKWMRGRWPFLLLPWAHQPEDVASRTGVVHPRSRKPPEMKTNARPCSARWIHGPETEPKPGCENRQGVYQFLQADRDLRARQRRYRAGMLRRMSWPMVVPQARGL